MEKYTKLVGIAIAIAMSIFLVGCKEKEFETILPPEENIEVRPEGYEEMRIKRGKHDAEKYQSAEEQQFIEIDDPKVMEANELIAEVDEELLVKLKDVKFKRMVKSFEDEDQRPEINEIRDRYKKIESDMRIYKETHPDAPLKVKETYKNSVGEIYKSVEERISLLVEMNERIENKLEGNFSLKETDKIFKTLEELIEGQSFQRVNYDQSRGTILNYYDKRDEKDVDDTN